MPIDWYGPLPDTAQITESELHPNLNPPFQTLLVAPLGLLPYKSAFWVWSALSLLAGGVAAALIARQASQTEHRSRTVCLSILLLAYFPTIATIMLGQLSLWLLLFLTIAWVSARAGNDRAAGIALGIAVSSKTFVGLIVLLFLVMRRWRLLAWMIGTATACALAALLVTGPETYLNYLSKLGSVTWYAASWNASFLGFTTRILGGSENTPLIQLPGLARGLAYGASLIVAVVLTWLAWPRHSEISRSRFDALFALTLVAMLLISPLGWMYYFPALLIALVVAWQASEELPSPHFRLMILLSVGT